MTGFRRFGAAMAAVAAFGIPTVGNAYTLVIDAYIDGRDHLILQADTAQWLHLDYAAVGRWVGQDLPTYFDGVPWTPEWPGYPAPNEIRVHGATSAVYTGLNPALPSRPMSVALTDLTVGRGTVSIVQYPDSANAYTLKIEFDDNPIGEPATTYAGWYQVRLDVSPVPEPASWGLLIAGLGMVGWAAHRRRCAEA